MDYIKIGDNTFETKLAISQEEQEKGLMNYKWPPPVMSFVYGSPKFNSFWMKNTPSPLDIVFCNNNKIIDIFKGIPNSTAIISNHKLSDLVIELPEGTCKQYGIKSGDSIKLICDKNSKLKIFSMKSSVL